MKQLLLCLCLFLPLGALCQTKPAKQKPPFSGAGIPEWPRNAKTGLVEFKGEKAISGTQSHRDSIQARIDRWRARADDSRFANEGKLSAVGTMYGGCTLTPMRNTENGYNFLFMVTIKQTPKGFSYKIDDFKCIYSLDQKPESILLDDLLRRQEHNPYDWVCLRSFRKRFDELLSTL